MALAGIEITCPTCQKKWIICKKCYRGNKYCTSHCQVVGNKEKRKLAQIKYARSRKGQLNQSKRQRKYRLKLVKNKRIKKTLRETKKVTHRSIKKSQYELINIEKLQCWCCGCIVTDIYNENTMREYLLETHYHLRRS